MRAAAIIGCAAVALPCVAWSQATDEDAVRAVISAVAVYEQEGNLEAIDTLFAPHRGVPIIEGAGVNHGWAEYRDKHLAPELEHAENFQIRYYDIEPQVRENVAWASFRYELSVDLSERHVDMEGRGTAVLEKRDGRWLIVHLHTSGRRRRQ